MEKIIVMHDDYFVWIADKNFNRISNLYDYDCYSQWSYIEARDKAWNEIKSMGLLDIHVTR